MLKSSFTIEEMSDRHVFIVDCGNGNRMSVTNDAENVVEYLYNNQILNDNQRLFYRDSDNNIDEIIFKEGKFVRFKILNTRTWEGVEDYA